MAYKYIGVDSSVSLSEIAEGSSSTGKAVEIAIDTAKITDKGQISGLIDVLESWIKVNFDPV